MGHDFISVSIVGAEHKDAVPLYMKLGKGRHCKEELLYDAIDCVMEKTDGKGWMVVDRGMKNQWGWSGFTAHSLKQTALFAGMAVIAANLWNVFTRLGDDGMHHEAVTTRPLLVTSPRQL